jgi:hypothetical protein
MRSISLASLAALAAVVVAGAGPISPASAQAPDPGLLGRIEQGDFVWSVDFPRRDAALLGYGNALKDAFARLCPNAVSAARSTEINLFSLTWFGTATQSLLKGQALDLGGIVAATASSAMFRSSAHEELHRLVSGGGCTDPRVKALADNVGQMLSGRRPAHGTGKLRTSLVEEKVSAVRGRHAYLEKEVLLTPGEMQLEADFKQAAELGLTVLECHYDSVPDDMYYEVQYYWGMSALATAGFVVPRFAGAFFDSSQKRLVEANGQYYRHPFLTYGSPRWECPALKDTLLPEKQIYAPRRAVAPSNLPAQPAAPTITKTQAYTTYTYAAVREDYVPPLPDPLPPNGLVIKMDKQLPGSLTRVVLTPFGWASIEKSELDYPAGSPARTRLPEDVSSVAKESARVLRCSYVAERYNQVYVVQFWHQRRPRAADPAQLRSRIADHPILPIKEPRDNCPETYKEAQK